MIDFMLFEGFGNILTDRHLYLYSRFCDRKLLQSILLQIIKDDKIGIKLKTGLKQYKLSAGEFHNIMNQNSNSLILNDNCNLR